MKIRLFVLPDGSVAGRHADILLGAGFVPAKVKRFTNVEWDESQEKWVASTLTGKPLFSTVTRDLCLQWEGQFVDLLLKQFFMCRRHDGNMWCPDCDRFLGQPIRVNCPHCGKAFPNVIEDLEWKDFELEHLCCSLKASQNQKA